MNHLVRTVGAVGVAALVAVAVLAATSTSDPVDRAPTRAEDCGAQLSRAVHGFVAATDGRDAKAVERLMAPTSTLVLPGGRVLAGKDVASPFIERRFARTGWTQTFWVTVQTRSGCRSAVTVFASTYSDNDGVVPLVVALGWTRINGRWLIELDQSTVKD